ncbi:MAG: 5'-methylthioadenosine/adenosylhomocysteine nucleosidase [Candidatus Methanomethylophilaceae archaeon]|nr:5'-methylthioadenosine/adenosylhomocysteine nucleosidase [Candidatus Methanomethylophilaceae archaeon]
MRITNVLLVLAVAMVIACAGVVVVDDGDAVKERYGIVGAMEEEVVTLVNNMERDNVEIIAGTEYHDGKLCGKDVVVVRSGYGKVNAAMHTQTLIDRFHVTAVINTGVAGTLTADVGIGDIVVSTDTVQHDFELVEIGFPAGVVPEVGRVNIPADPALITKAVEGIKAASPDTNVFQGRVCTGDQFISGAEEMEPIIEQYGGLCCEMEGGAVAQVCYLNGLPFVVIRAISDEVNGDGPADYDQFMAEMASLCANMTMNMLRAM